MVRCSPHGAAWSLAALFALCGAAAAQTVLPVSSQAQALARCDKLAGVQPATAMAAAREVLDAPRATVDERLGATVCLAVSQLLSGQAEAGAASLDAGLALLDAPGVSAGIRLAMQSRLPLVLARAGRLDEALAMQEGALAAAREQGIVPVQIEGLRFMGQVRSAEFDDPEGALPYFRQAHELHRLLAGSSGQANPVISYDVGYTLLVLGRHDEADTLFAEAEGVVATTPELAGLGDRIASHRAEILRLGGNPAAAEPRFVQVLARQRVGGDLAGQSVTLQRLARARLNLGRIAQALAPARESLDAAERAGLNAERRDALDLLADVYAALGQREAAVTHAARAREVSRNLDREATARRLASLQARAASELVPEAVVGRVAEMRAKALRHIAIVVLGVLALVAVLLLVRAQRQQRGLAARSATDALTQLPNRHGATCRIEALKADGTARAALLLIGIDHFKAINDRMGHDAGDRALVAVAHCLRESCDAGDMVVRWGGVEFLVLREDTSQEAAFALAAHLRAQVERLQLDDGTGVPQQLSVSIGVASLPLFPTSNGGWQDAMRAASRALYLARHAGHNAWIGLWGLAADVDADRALGDVQAALAEGWFTIGGNRPMDWSIGRAAPATGDEDHLAVRRGGSPHILMSNASTSRDAGSAAGSKPH